MNHFFQTGTFFPLDLLDPQYALVNKLNGHHLEDIHRKLRSHDNAIKNVYQNN